MPKAWSDKDERQYEHIKESEKKQGRSTTRAKQIAAATVNKERSAEGRTKGSSGKSAASKKSASRSSSRKSSTRESAARKSASKSSGRKASKKK